MPLLFQPLPRRFGHPDADRPSRPGRRHEGYRYPVGGLKDFAGNTARRYALATNLGTVCQSLDIELVGDWNPAYEPYFGKFAHTTLPGLCPGLVQMPASGS